MAKDENLIKPELPPEPANSLDSPRGESLENQELSGAPTGSLPPASQEPFWRRLQRRINIYLLIFILLILAAVAVILVSVHNGNKTPSSVSSLTDQQLAAIKGSTTLVGDAKQTLDVQSNSIFEGKVLVRSDLSIAGSLKVGGALSLTSITVGGSGNFGQLGINGGLNVGGDTSLQGNVTVQKNLSVSGSASFGSLSVSSLNVNSLQLKGDLGLSRHVSTSGGLPGRSGGSALGSGGTVSISGSDTAGTVTINTGSGPPAGCFVTINFVSHYGTTPHVVISPSNSSAGTIQYYTNRNTTGFSICTANGPAAATTYIYDYVVID